MAFYPVLTTGEKLDGAELTLIEVSLQFFSIPGYLKDMPLYTPHFVGGLGHWGRILRRCYEAVH